MNFIITAQDAQPRFATDDARIRFRQFLRKHEGKKLRMIIEEAKTKRSLNQNAYLWLCYNTIAEETGNDPDDIHMYCKATFLPKRFVQIKDKELQMSGKTSTLTISEFMEYMEKVIAWAGRDLGIKLPDPSEYDDQIR